MYGEGEMAIEKLRPWLLPLAWLLGFMCGWGMILVDRQMIIASQAELQEELQRTKRQLQVVGAADEFGSRVQKIVIWNKQVIEPEEVPSGQVDK